MFSRLVRMSRRCGVVRTRQSISAVTRLSVIPRTARPLFAPFATDSAGSNSDAPAATVTTGQKTGSDGRSGTGTGTATSVKDDYVIYNLLREDKRTEAIAKWKQLLLRVAENPFRVQTLQDLGAHPHHELHQTLIRCAQSEHHSYADDLMNVWIQQFESYLKSTAATAAAAGGGGKEGQNKSVPFLPPNANKFRIPRPSIKAFGIVANWYGTFNPTTIKAAEVFKRVKMFEALKVRAAKIGVQWNGYVFAKFMSLLAQVGQTHRIKDLIETRFKEYGIQPKPIHFQYYLVALAGKPDPEPIFQLLKWMRDLTSAETAAQLKAKNKAQAAGKGKAGDNKPSAADAKPAKAEDEVEAGAVYVFEPVGPTQSQYHRLLWMYGRKQNQALVDRVFKEMTEVDGFTPTQDTYNTVMDGWGSLLSVATFEAVYHQMQNHPNPALRAVPDVGTFRLGFRAAGRERNLTLANQLISDLRRLEIFPRKELHTLVIGTYSLCRDFNSVQSFFTSYKAAGYGVTSHVFHAILHPHVSGLPSDSDVSTLWNRYRGTTFRPVATADVQLLQTIVQRWTTEPPPVVPKLYATPSARKAAEAALSSASAQAPPS